MVLKRKSQAPYQDKYMSSVVRCPASFLVKLYYIEWRYTLTELFFGLITMYYNCSVKETHIQ